MGLPRAWEPAGGGEASRRRQDSRDQRGGLTLGPQESPRAGAEQRPSQAEQCPGSSGVRRWILGQEGPKCDSRHQPWASASQHGRTRPGPAKAGVPLVRNSPAPRVAVCRASPRVCAGFRPRMIPEEREPALLSSVPSCGVSSRPASLPWRCLPHRKQDRESGALAFLGKGWSCCCYPPSRHWLHSPLGHYDRSPPLRSAPVAPWGVGWVGYGPCAPGYLSWCCGLFTSSFPYFQMNLNAPLRRRSL